MLYKLVKYNQKPLPSQSIRSLVFDLKDVPFVFDYFLCFGNFVTVSIFCNLLISGHLLVLS